MWLLRECPGLENACVRCKLIIYLRIYIIYTQNKGILTIVRVIMIMMMMIMIKYDNNKNDNSNNIQKY